MSYAKQQITQLHKDFCGSEVKILWDCWKSRWATCIRCPLYGDANECNHLPSALGHFRVTPNETIVGYLQSRSVQVSFTTSFLGVCHGYYCFCFTG